MNNKYILFLILFFFACSEQADVITITPDGLPAPNKTEQMFKPDCDPLISDECYGIKQKDTFFINTHSDKKRYKIIRGVFITGTAHGYTFYEMYSYDGTEIAKFRTVEGADCFLEAYKFQFNPFVLTKVSRPWEQDWAHPTKSKIEKYQIVNNKLEKISEISGPIICDVRELLN